MLQDEFRPQRRVVIATIATVTATYVYFLIFAQFGFLKTVQSAPVSTHALKFLMGLMGAGGITGSVLAARWHSVPKGTQRLQVGFSICGGAALLALMPSMPALFYPAALAAGFGLGLTTVTLVGLLRRALGGAHLGTVIGLSTGLAYAFCNLPRVFMASGLVQTGVAVGAAVVGLVASRQIMLKTVPDKPTGFDYTAPGMTCWVLVFLGLVMLDSAAFFIIQNTPIFQQTGWSQPGGLLANAGVHLSAALLTGYALDRRWVGRTIFVAAVALMVACFLFGASNPDFTSGTILYAAAVSAYSTVLLFYPARGMRPWLAAAVYGVSGWLGSGLGIVLAQNLVSIPRWLMIAAAGLIFGVLFLRSRGHENQFKNV